MVRDKGNGDGDIADLTIRLLREMRAKMATKDDLGPDEYGPGVRPLGKVQKPQPLIGFDGKIREGLTAP